MRKLFVLLALLLSASALAQNVGPDQRPHSGVFRLNAPRLGPTTFPNGTSIDANGSLDITASTSQGLNVTNNTNQPIISKGGTTIVRLGNSGNDIFFGLNIGLSAGGFIELNNDNNPSITSSSTAVRIQAGHVEVNNTAPTMGACGTSPSVVGNDTAMDITVGTGGAATSCAVTFAANFANAPICSVISGTDKVAYSITPAVGSLTIAAAAAFTASSHLYVHCIGRY